MFILTNLFLTIIILILGLILALFDLFTFSVIADFTLYFITFVLLYALLLLFPHFSILVLIWGIILLLKFIQKNNIIWLIKNIINRNNKEKKEEIKEKDILFEWEEEEVIFISLYDIYWLSTILFLFIVEIYKYIIILNPIITIINWILFIIFIYWLLYYIQKYVYYTSKKYNLSIKEILNFNLFYKYEEIYNKKWFQYLIKELKTNFIESFIVKINEKDKKEIKQIRFIPLYVILFIFIICLL